MAFTPFAGITRTGSNGRGHCKGPLSARSVRAPVGSHPIPARFAQVPGPIHRSTGMPSLRALVCDDYSMVRETIRPILVEAGFETVREASLATEAISLAEMSQPDVIVLDLSLPGMSGLQAIPILKLVSPRSTIIVFSAYVIWREACVDAGASTYVDKGDLEALSDALGRVATKTPLGRIIP